jgi:CubicO group peptidase (beta-lactamase class C family)
VAGVYDEAVRRIESFAVTHLAGEPVAGAAIALTDENGPIAEAQLGFADLERERPVEAGTVFPIASIAKAMTATCVLQQAEAGALNLDERVETYLPWLPLEGVTVRHLLTHTAGLVGGMEVSPSTVGESRSLLSLPRGRPGERVHSSNIGYGVLGLVLESAAEEPYAAVMRRGILAPLGMKESTAITGQLQQLRAAVGYVVAGEGTEALVRAPWIATDSGAGSACCTAADLAVFLRALLRGGDPILTPESFELMTTPGLEGSWYGCGLVVDSLDGHPLIGHDGDCPGFQSHMWADPEAKVGVVVLWSGPGSTEAIVDHAIALLRAARTGEPLPADPAPAVAKDAIVTAARSHPYGGTYRSHNPWVPFVRVVSTEGNMELQYPWGTSEPLEPIGGGEYRVGEEGSPERARFSDEVDGYPLYVHVSGQRFDRTPW